MNKLISILMIVFLGSMLLSNEAIACGKKSEKKSCSAEKSKNSEKKCCSSEKKCCCKKQKNKTNEDEDCGGNCDSKSCNCSSFHSSFIVPVSDDSKAFNSTITVNKNNFPTIEVCISDGFNFIWTPPNLI